jgi:hypothetical protein
VSDVSLDAVCCSLHGFGGDARERCDQWIGSEFAPEPRPPAPRLRDWVLGAVVYGLLVAVDWATRRR